MTDDDNKNGNPDFEDDVFDETSFDESYYEDDGVYDENDLPDDAEFEDVDFDETEWNEDDASPVAGKREKSLYRSEKKSFLSFNTIVILGAVVVGAGVLVFTVMGESSKVSSNIVPKFISSLNIGDVMDGGLFGLGEKEDAPATGEASLSESTSAIEQDAGFLDNPDALELQANSTDLPPQPTPISPTEMATDSALTPMPDIVAPEPVQVEGMIPRGPDETLAVAPEPEIEGDVQAILPEETAQPSAEDILKRAMANRGQKQENPPAKEQVAAVEKAPEDVPVVPMAEPAPKPVAKVKDVPEPEKEPVVQKPVPAPVAEVSAASDEAIKSLESKIDIMLKRMEQIETELSSVREGSEDEYKSLEKTVTSLKGDIVSLKNAPAPKPQAIVAKEEAKPAPAPKAVVKKAETPKKVPASPKREEPAYSPPKQAAAPATQTQPSTAWELRAAQPGKAWVSKAGQRDMQGVVVGETLSGIGRVTSISYQGGRWVVTGTQGQIRQ